VGLSLTYVATGHLVFGVPNWNFVGLLPLLHSPVHLRNNIGRAIPSGCAVGRRWPDKAILSKLAAEPKTILLVEDNADDEQLTLRAMRQSDVPNIIRVARDGAEAIEALFSADSGRLPDLVLLDLKLPKVSGLEVLHRIRNEDRTRTLPIVILTSSDEERDIVESYNLGANSYIRKPVDFDEFIDAVRQLGLYWLSMNRTARD
jgi:two-component system response regulator